MNKKLIGIIVAVVVMLIAGAAALIIWRHNSSEEPNRDESQSQTGSDNRPDGAVTNPSTTNQGTIDMSNSKILVAYYSAQNHTKAVAQKIAANLGADLFEIVPKDVYTSADLDWTDDSSRVNREHNDENLRNIELVATTVDNWSEYDTVLIGYPIWWGIAAWPVDAFVKANNFGGKTVIPFATSTSSSLGQSGQLLADEADGGNWLPGRRFSSNPSDGDIKSWTDSLL